jgi:hypothetical protein
MIAYASR